MLHDYNDKHKINWANFTFCTSVCALWAVIWQVNQTKVRGQAPLVDPVPEKVGGQLTPWTPGLHGPCLVRVTFQSCIQTWSSSITLCRSWLAANFRWVCSWFTSSDRIVGLLNLLCDSDLRACEEIFWLHSMSHSLIKGKFSVCLLHCPVFAWHS